MPTRGRLVLLPKHKAGALGAPDEGSMRSGRRPERSRGPSNETARVHHAARRRGGGVAARGARAAAGDAGDRVSPQHVARRRSSTS